MKKREPSSSRRNPPWTRDELILALDAYFNLVQTNTTPDARLSEIKELRDILAKYSQICVSKQQTPRTKSSIVMKMMNFRSIDPDYPGAGLKSVGTNDRRVWDEFTKDKKLLNRTAKAIRQNLTGKTKPFETNEPFEANEGMLTRLHLVRERSSTLIRHKKQKVLAEYGHLACEACNFRFEIMYGQRGSGFIEVHHIKPVHTLTPGSKTNLDDLALLCANCHRMIHAKIPWLEVEELKKIINNSSTDIFTASKRSEIMSKVRSSGNKSTEIKLIEIFRKNKITGWQRQINLPGKPDFFFSREKICVFADGCFWHKCPKCFKLPKNKPVFWRNKIEENVRRDLQVRRKLRRMGFSVLTIWECDIKKRPQVVVEKILRAIKNNS